MNSTWTARNRQTHATMAVDKIALTRAAFAEFVGKAPTSDPNPNLTLTQHASLTSVLPPAWQTMSSLFVLLVYGAAMLTLMQ